MFTLESSHRDNSNEYTQYTIFNMNKKGTLNYPLSAAMGFSEGLKSEFETSMVNDPSVFEPLKFYCNRKVMLTTRGHMISTVLEYMPVYRIFRNCQ